MAKRAIGKVTHYFNRIGVGAIDLKDGLKVGDTILVEGVHTYFTQRVGRIQIEHHDVSGAGPGDSVGVKTQERVREGDKIFLLEE